jgi:hypothetical protein
MALLLQGPAPWSIVGSPPVRLEGRTPKQDVKKHATVAEVRAQVSAMIEARVSRYASLALTPAEPVPSAFR